MLKVVSHLSLQEQLTYYAGIILDPNSFYGDIKLAVEHLHLLFVQLGGVNSDDQVLTKGTYLPSGLAVSPIVAAKCAFDLARTRKFLQGLKQALHLLLQQESSRPIQVLYAGSGPYALLALLVCSFFKKGEVEFTVLDLHSASVESVKRLINGFSLEHFFPEIIVADATQYKWEKALPLHMFIVETLQRALQNEQQVTIAAQIAPQLAPGGIMIPERIEVTAVLVNTELRHALQLSLEPNESGGKPIVDIGLVINLNKDSAIHAANTITEPFAPVNFSLPSEFLRPPYTLELHTTITVFGQEQIKDFDSALTMPIVISRADQLIGKKEIAFNYINTIVPRVEWKIT